MEQEVHLTLHGLVHHSGPSAEVSISASFAAVAEANTVQSAIWPSAPKVTPVEVNSTEFTARSTRATSAPRLRPRRRHRDGRDPGPALPLYHPRPPNHGRTS